MNWVGAGALLIGLVGLLYALAAYVAGRRDPYRDQMGVSIRFDQQWMLSAAAGALGAKLLWGFAWGGFLGLVLLAYLLILPLKAGVKWILER